MKKLLALIILVVVAGGIFFLYKKKSEAKQDEAVPTVKVTRGNLVDKALAIGTIEPENEISIKSKVSGVVEKLHVKIGDYVKAGQPLIEIKPDPTPLELADAKRQIELREADLENLRKEKARQESLKEKQLGSSKDYDDISYRVQEAGLQLSMAKERLALIEKGHITIGNTRIEGTIKAPIDGYVLSKYVEVGDPVTPLTSYQEGTVLMRIANMENLIFRGTVDEIDVGRLNIGMETELTIGALPGQKVKGALRLISLKADKKDNTTVFPIEILVQPADSVTLRAGYSANADIIIERRDSVLTVPERVVYFRNDSAFVKVPQPNQQEKELLIKTGLSDAINVEVMAGLSENDDVLEKPVKEVK